MAEHTEIKVYTPENYEFHESEIPISITTEGATHPFQEGLTISPVIQRYLFHVDFYPDEKSDVPQNEVYYQEWFPDAQEIKTNFNFIPYIAEANEYAYFVVSFKTGATALPQPMPGASAPIIGDKNYIFRLQFLGNSWPRDLGYKPNTQILGVPCFVQGLTANPTIQCDIYTRLDTDPYIMAYGVQDDIPANTQVTLHFPAIKIGNVTQGTIA